MKSHFNHFIKHLAHGFALLFIFILLLRFFNLIPGYWGNKTIYLFFISLISGTIFLGWEISEDKNTIKEDSPLVLLVSSLFIIFLTLVILNEFFVISFLRNFKLELVSVSIALGALTFYANHNGVMDKFQKENDDESELENERKRDFSHNFPTLSKIPLIKIFLKWMYKEGWIYGIGLILTLAVAFFLRVYHVGRLGLTVDESWAYAVGENLIREGTFVFRDTFSYYRGWPYTLLVALSFILLGVSEFSLRLVSAILGTLTIIPLYALIKRITNKKTALIASIFLAFFTWHIFYSRWGRHYILASFLLVTSFYYTYLYFSSNFKQYVWPSIISTGLMVLTLKELLLVPIFYVGLAFFQYKFRPSFLKNITLLLGYITPIVLTLFIPEQSSPGLSAEGYVLAPLFLRFPEWVMKWVSQDSSKYFFSNALYSLSTILLIMYVIFLLVSPLILKRGKGLIVLLSPVIVFILMNVIGRDKPWTIRQISFLLPFFIILLILVIAFTSKNKKYTTILYILSFIAVFNPVHFSMLSHLDYGTPVKDTIYQLTPAERAYADYKTPADYLLSNMREGDIVISDGSAVLTYIYDKTPAYLLSDLDENRDILLIQQLVGSAGDRVWILNTLINDERFHFKNRNGKVRQFLDSHKDNIVYTGKDNLSTVYLFDNRKN